MSAMVGCSPIFLLADSNILCSIKREIGHLCHDDRRPKPDNNGSADSVPATTAAPAQGYSTSERMSISTLTSANEVLATMYAPTTTTATRTTPAASTSGATWSIGSQSPFMYQSDTLGNEFSVLTCVLMNSSNYRSYSAQ